jgi:signal transduction histidine kinase
LAEKDQSVLGFIRRRISLKYLLATAGTILLIFGLLFVALAEIEEGYILEQVKKQAVILHEQIVLTRRWVSDHNHILVRKRPGMEAESLQVHPEVADARGNLYAVITPSMLTRELSRYAAANGLYSFNLTNTNGINPENRPDDFEASALAHFRAGNLEGTDRIQVLDGRTVFRYAAPLIVQPSCLACHDSGNLKPGDIGGCISVDVPMDRARQAIRRNTYLLLFSLLALACSVTAVLFLSARALVFKRIRELRLLTDTLPPDSREPSGTDELGEVARRLQEMNQRLRDQNQELEAKINHATRDLSETNAKLVVANRRLSALNSARQEFFTDISHELRTPLTSIKGAADTLERKGVCNDDAYLRIIRNNTEFLIKTVVDLLDYARLETGHLELDRKSASISTIAREVMESQNAEAQTRNVSLVLEAPDLMVLSFDEKRIFQVLTNLVSNALKFSPSGGTVLVAIQETDGIAEVSVSDSGPGIPAEYHESVFEKYRQGPLPAEPAFGLRASHGIGLAICKGLVEAHGGTIRVESKPGAGSRFIFTLPLEPVDA